MAKVGELTASESTPRHRHRAFMKVVLPAPMGAWKATMLRPETSRRNSRAALSISDRSFIIKLCCISEANIQSITIILTTRC